MRTRQRPRQWRLAKPRATAGFTFCEICCCLFVGLCGLATTLVAGEKFGTLGYVLGFPACLLGLFVIGVIAGSLEAAYAYFARGWPPPCHTGKCSGAFSVWGGPDHGDYEVAVVNQDVFYRCQCGREYDRVGRRFMERLSDGTLKPYMVHRSFRGWFPDTDSDD